MDFEGRWIGYACRVASVGATPRRQLLSNGFLGLWRSLVAHLTGGQGVAGSNPVSPTNVYSRRTYFSSVRRENYCRGEARVVTELLAVLHNPPVGDGRITRSRTALAARILGHHSWGVVNVVVEKTQTSLEIGNLDLQAEWGAVEWMQLNFELAKADEVLLAYGLSAPIGPSRSPFRRRLSALHEALEHHGVPVVTLGGKPRHPSRWQRYTHKTHPGVPFDRAIAMSLERPASLHDVVSPALGEKG